ncbi:MAG: glycoside hydrolase family 57 protein [Nitrososphaerota archaeon]|nr:glycoside hydrolase family 57 protein [Candidatus Calditenuaceae archaeon]MDW8072656.1 glycoside hydrolase family 57 protein [Nitrososphaerota archaeon]
MPSVCLSFEVHQPLRLNTRLSSEELSRATVENIPDAYLDNTLNREIFQRVTRKCYIPANDIILRAIEEAASTGRDFKVNFSISGVFLEQAERYAPRLIEQFKMMVETGKVEMLEQTYYHSIASLYGPESEEFTEQVEMHRETIKSLLGYEPKVFENTELLFNNSIARKVAEMGYKGIIVEGVDWVLQGRSPNHLYLAADTSLKVLTRNYRLSDDIAFRFSERTWPGFPLTADKYASWLAATPGDYVLIFVDYETFGEHHWPESGIHEFLRHLPREALKHENIIFNTASEIVMKFEPVGVISVGDLETISWADVEKSTDAWLSSEMQMTCFNALKRMERPVKKASSQNILRAWRVLQISDHLYYMFTRRGPSGVVHAYFGYTDQINMFYAMMRALSHLQLVTSEVIGGDVGEAVRLLRVVPPDRAFHYHEDGRYIGLSAHSLYELLQTIPLATKNSLIFHMACRQLERWVRWTIGDRVLADRIREIEADTSDELVKKLVTAVGERIRELESRMGF